MSDVPSDIYREILLRLPAESLLRFRAVCRAWRFIIDDSSFIKLHTLNQRSSSSSSLLIEDCLFNLLYFLSLKSLTYAHPAQPTVDLTYIENLVDCGVPRLLELPTITCRGLILHFLSDSTKDWVIWNPLSLDFHKLSVPEHKHSMELASTGLGYDYAADEYKVVRIDAIKSESELVLKTRVYSLKSRTWKVIKDYPSDTLKSCGVYLNGALHWISKTLLVSLDLATEEYRLLPLPPLPAVSSESATMYLDALDGCLFVSYYYIGGDCVDSWIMKDEISTEITWSKLLPLSGGHESKRVGGSMTVFKPMAYSKSRGEVIMRHDAHFYCIDIPKNRRKKVIIHGLPGYFDCQLFQGSLVRLFNDDGGCAAAETTYAAAKMNRRSNQRLEHSVTVVDDLLESIWWEAIGICFGKPYSALH